MIFLFPETGQDRWRICFGCMQRYSARKRQINLLKEKLMRSLKDLIINIILWLFPLTSILFPTTELRLFADLPGALQVFAVSGMFTALEGIKQPRKRPPQPLPAAHRCAVFLRTPASQMQPHATVASLRLLAVVVLSVMPSVPP